MLLGGLAIGWIVKPSTPLHENHEHTSTSTSENTSSEEIWTCSMHPQIRQNEAGLCPICEMDLIPVDNSMGNDDPTVLQMSKESAKLAQIETFIVGENTNQANKLINSVKTDGTVQLDERSIKTQTAHLSGRIETMAVTFEGQYVTKGQQIASLYSTELIAASQELLTAVQFNTQIDGLREAATKKLKNWKITDDQIQTIINSGKPIETISIYADHNGYVLNKKLSQGDYVKQGQTLYTLGTTSNLWLIFDIFESDLSKVRKGSKVVFTTPALPSKEFNANITYIDPLLNSISRTATARAEIRNYSNQLKPGMLLNGFIEVKSQNNKKANKTISVPNSAILWTGKKSVVFVQLPDSEVPSYQYREVNVIDRTDDFSTISTGLEIGEEVVSHGAFAVDAAAQLNNNLSMMNKNVSVKKDKSGDATPSYINETPDAFKNQLDLLLTSYINLKNALVDTDQEASSLAASEVIENASKIDMTLLKGEAHLFWMEQLKAIVDHTEKIESNKDIEEQRNQFDFLSQAIINSVKAFGTNDKSYYVQYCPMSKDNQGADWLSTEEQIRNPYFGDKMMKCGTVKLELN